MKELKVVRLKDVRIIADGCTKTRSVRIVDSCAVVCLFEPRGLEINGKRIESTKEIPDVIHGCIVRVYEDAFMLINVGECLYVIFSDGGYGHIVSIPKEWLRVVGF